MINFTRELATHVVKKALHSVADFNDTTDITEFSFAPFNEYHRSVFMASLKNEVLNIKGDDYYYDIALNPDDVNNWQIIKDCINYLLKYTDFYAGQTERLNL